MLTVREIAVYDVVLNLIYDRGGACPADPGFIYSHFRHDRHLQRSREVQATQQAIDQLVKQGKLHVQTTIEGRWLTNGRADVELGRANGRIDRASKAGVASGAARRVRRLAAGSPSARRRPDAKASDNNDLMRTAVRNTNHQESSSSSTESDAARATVRVSDALPAARPTTKLDPRLEAAAKAARAKLLARGSS